MLKPRHLLLGLSASLVSASLLPVALQAAPVQLPCKLPARGDWQMTNERSGWSRDGKPWTVTATQSIGVGRDASGIKLTLGIVSATSDLQGAARRRLIAAFGPNGRQPITIWLAQDGRIITVENLDQHWKANLGIIEQVARDMEEAGEPGAPRARAALAGLGQVDEQARIAMVAAGVGPFLRFCGQQVEGDEVGNLVVVKADNDGPQLRESATYRIDGVTGLAIDIARRIAVKAQPERPQVDRWRFVPVPATAINQP